MMIAFKNIHLKFGNRTILNDLQGEFEVGQIHGLIGPNGAGKSTLLNALAGLNYAQGEVYYDLVNIHKYSYEELAKQRAYCEQKSRLEINFTVKELIAFGVEANGKLPKNKLEEAIDFIASYCGIEAYIHQRILNLSGGEQQLVHFARAVAQIHPELNMGTNSILFLDEPNSALDIKNTMYLYDRMLDLKSLGVTVLCVLHNLNECITLCDTLSLMEKGNIVLQASTDKVLESKILDHVFGVNFNRTYNNGDLTHLQPQLNNDKQYDYVR